MNFEETEFTAKNSVQLFRCSWFSEYNGINCHIWSDDVATICGFKFHVCNLR
jgi:hypothetical protein